MASGAIKKRVKLGIRRCLTTSRMTDVIRASTPPRLIVFNYHRIREAHQATRFDPELYGPDQVQFSSQIEWIARRYDILSEDRLAAVVESGMKLTRHSAMITFDDGYRDNYELAYPILKAKRVPAVFFIPTGSIVERTLGPWDIIAWMVQGSTRKTITLRGHDFATTGEAGRTSIRDLISLWKLLPGNEVSTFLEELGTAADVRMPSRDEQDAELMTWDHLREVSRNAVAIGSHTHSHSVLAGLDLAAQKEELRVSKALLERNLGVEVRSLAYPVGLYEHFHVESKELARQCGYQFAFSFLTGFESARIADPYDIRRAFAPEPIVDLDVATAFPQHYFGNRSTIETPAHYVAPLRPTHR